jgi:predicted SAM-dependent methyltransferase
MTEFNEAEYLALYPDVVATVKAGAFKSGHEHYLKHGKTEGRSSSFAANATPRQKAVFHLIDQAGLGLEIGPSHNPIAPKKNGYKVHILDHASEEELRAKYQNHGLNLDNIEEVDFIWQGQSLPELVGKKHCYDWIIASHVVEHLPDLMAFLQQCEELLKPKGVLSLVIPDKRYRFDYFQPLSTTGMLLDAHAEQRTRPCAGQIFDHFANAATLNGVIAWSEKSAGGADGLIHNFTDAKNQYERRAQTDEYIDVHCWRFTPESFNLIVSDLVQLGLINLEIKAQFPTSGCEFYVTLGIAENAHYSDENSRLTHLRWLISA